MNLSEIASDVAAALGLGQPNPAMGWQDPLSRAWLKEDGYNLTDPYWRCRCEDWAISQGWNVTLFADGEHIIWRGIANKFGGRRMPSFCWWCGKKLMKTWATYTDDIGNEHLVHKCCAKDCLLHNKPDWDQPGREAEAVRRKQNA